MKHTNVNSPSHQRPKYLIIDDDADIAEVTRMLVSRYSGKNSDCVSDSYEAIDAFYANSYDCLFVDQNLPGLKGLEILTALDKAIDSDPVLSDQIRFMNKMPVVLMSAARIRVPKKLNLKYFSIQDVIAKRSLSSSIAKYLVS